MVELVVAGQAFVGYVCIRSVGWFRILSHGLGRSVETGEL